MMPTFFKVTCAVFWIVWMVTVSFIFGVLQIQDKYSYIETRSELTVLMILACACTILMAVLGCCCIKLEIQHACCAVWYIIPTLTFTLLLCTSMLIYLRSDDSKMMHEEGDVLRMIRKDLQQNMRIPKFLYHTQLHYGCCGVYGFKDYRAFFLPPNIKQDIPYGCCTDRSFGAKKKCPSGDPNEDPRNTVYNIYLSRTINGTTLPYDIPSDQEDSKLVPIVDSLYGTIAKHGNAPGRYLNETLNLPVNRTKLENINLHGCFEHLKANSQKIHNYYFAFSLFLIACSIVMCVLFGRNCINARRLQHVSYQKLMLESMKKPPKLSSLDPELEITREKAVETMLLEDDRSKDKAVTIVVDDKLKKPEVHRGSLLP